MQRSSHSRPHILYSTDSKCHQKFATKTRPKRSDEAKFSVECYWRCWNRFAVMTFHLLSSLHNALLVHHLMAKDNVSKSTYRKILLLTMQKGYKSKFSYTSNNFCARERYFFGNFGMQYNNFFCLCVYVGHLVKHQTGEFFFETFWWWNQRPSLAPHFYVTIKIFHEHRNCN